MKKTILIQGLSVLILVLFSGHSLLALSCSNATEIKCGDDNWYAAPAANHFNKWDYDLSGCYNLSSPYDGKDAFFYVDVGSDPMDLVITLYGMSHNQDLDLFVFKSCDSWADPQFSQCVGNSFRGGNKTETVEVEDATGIYYIIVDAYLPQYSSDFKLKVACDAAAPDPPPSLCHNIPDIWCGQKVIARNSYYDHRASDVLDQHRDCHGITRSYEGYEVVYRLSGGAHGLRNVTIDLHSVDYGNHDLFIYRTCEKVQGNYGDWRTVFSGSAGYCHSSYYNHGPLESAFIDYVAPYEELYIVVEGAPVYHYGYYSGRFELVVSCGGPCEQYVKKIDCNSSVSSSTYGGWNKSSYYSCDPHSNRGHNWGPEKTYRLEIEDKSNVRIDLEVDHGADLNLYLLKNCDQKQCIAGSKTVGKGKDESIEVTLYPGTYFIVVDGYLGDAGAFRLNVSGCQCSNARRLYCDWPQTGSTYGASNDVHLVRGDCFPYSTGVETKGRDQIYYFRAPQSQEYVFTLTGLKADLDLFALDNCNDPYSCRGFSTKTGKTDEWIRLYLERNEEIFLVVDSRWSTLTSEYRIEVLCEEEPESCFTYEVAEDHTVTFNLTGLIKSNCYASSQTLIAYPVDAGTGHPDYSSPHPINITDESASFEPDITGMYSEYYVCFSRSCHWDEFSCCVTLSFQGTLDCGETYASTTKGKASNFDKDDVADCYNSGSSFKGADELVPFSKAEGVEVITLTMFQKTANLSMFILDEELNVIGELCKGANFMANKEIGNSGAVGEYWTDAEDPLPAGNYYALIEGYGTYIASDYDLTMTCGLDCAGAEVLECGMDLEDQASDEGSNQESAYLVEGELKVGYTGAERVYEIETAELTEAVITLSGFGGSDDFDLFLLTSDCDAGDVVAASVSSGSGDEEIVIQLEPGTYYVVVDGYKGSSGTFDLTYYGCASTDVAPEDIFHSAVREKTANALDNRTGITVERTFPNPFNKDLFFDITAGMEGDIRIDMWGSDGVMLYSRNRSVVGGQNLLRIEAEEVGINSGLIYYRVTSKHGHSTGKVLKMTE